MSYAKALPMPPYPAPVHGMGALLDNNLNTKAYYISFVELWDQKLGLRKYYWSPIKYLSNWDAMGFAGSYSFLRPPQYQVSTLYQWDGASWKKTALPRL